MGEKGKGGGGSQRTGLVKNIVLVNDVAQGGLLGAYLLITFSFSSCQHDQLVVGCYDIPK